MEEIENEDKTSFGCLSTIINSGEITRFMIIKGQSELLMFGCKITRFKTPYDLKNNLCELVTIVPPA